MTFFESAFFQNAPGNHGTRDRTPQTVRGRRSFEFCVDPARLAVRAIFPGVRVGAPQLFRTLGHPGQIPQVGFFFGKDTVCIFFWGGYKILYIYLFRTQNRMIFKQSILSIFTLYFKSRFKKKSDCYISRFFL